MRGYGFQGGGDGAGRISTRRASARTTSRSCATACHERAPRRLRRVPAVLRELRRDRQERGRRVRHPGAADQHGVGRQREGDDPRHGGHRRPRCSRRPGAKNIQPFTVPDRVPGYGIHEVGVARMGDDPKTSVLNQFQQAHDVANLFVMDGACFPSCGCQNPTLTIMALAVRSSDYLLERDAARRICNLRYAGTEVPLGSTSRSAGSTSRRPRPSQSLALHLVPVARLCRHRIITHVGQGFSPADCHVGQGFSPETGPRTQA